LTRTKLLSWSDVDGGGLVVVAGTDTVSVIVSGGVKGVGGENMSTATCSDAGFRCVIVSPAYTPAHATSSPPAAASAMARELGPVTIRRQCCCGASISGYYPAAMPIVRKANQCTNKIPPAGTAPR
jgi:hypothetical protein